MDEEEKTPEIDNTSLDGYSSFDIGIVPTIKPVGGFESGASPPNEDGFNPPDIQGGFADGMGEVTTLEDCESVSRMLWNTPGMFFGDHLLRSDEQIKLFAKELYLYCSKNNVDPRDYMMDWMPLAAIGGSMAVGMYKDHKDHKKEKKESAGFNKPAGSKSTFDTGLGITDSGSTDEMEELVLKENLNPASSSGGDDIIEEV